MSEVSEIVAETLAVLEARDEEKRKRQEEMDAYADKKVEEAVKAAKAEFGEKAKAWEEAEGEVAVSNVKKVTKLGSGGTPEGGPVEAFTHWMVTGEEIVARKELTENPYGDAGEAGKGLDAEAAKVLSSASGAAGEYLVPDDFVSPIIAKRDDISFPRMMGVQIYKTDLKVVDLPAEDTSITKFTRTAESGAYSTNDPTFAQNQVTVNNMAVDKSLLITGTPEKETRGKQALAVQPQRLSAGSAQAQATV